MEHGGTTNERLKITGRRLLLGIPRPQTHRGWLARHGGRAAPVAHAEAVHAPASPAFPFALEADASVPEQVRTKAESIVAHMSRFAPRPILYARMTIRTEHDPAVRRPAIATAALDVSGSVVFAHAAAATPRDAVDLIERRLRRGLDRLAEQRRRGRR